MQITNKNTPVLSGKINLFKCSYYRNLDGIYNSFWVGKFINMLIYRGNKKKITKQVYKAFLNLKILHISNPNLFFLEILEQIKPFIKLENCFPGKTMVIYPKVVTKQKQYQVALRWLTLAIIENENRLIKPFNNQIYLKLLDLKQTRKHPVYKKRDQYHHEAINLQENIRYSWSRI